jgi:hypothetical protein
MKLVFLRIWFTLLVLIYVLQALTLIFVPLTIILWILGISNNYIDDYVKYTKKIFYQT